MKKILMSVMVIGIVVAMLGAGTLAWFSDIETATGNTFQAGDLNLIVGDNDPTTAQLSVHDIKPGDSGDADWVLKNFEPTSWELLDGELTIEMGWASDLENWLAEPELPGDTVEKGELGENLDLLVYIDEDLDDTYTVTADTLVYQGKARDICPTWKMPHLCNEGTEYLTGYSMPANAEESLRIEWSVDSGVGNNIMNDNFVFLFKFTLDQVH